MMNAESGGPVGVRWDAMSLACESRSRLLFELAKALATCALLAAAACRDSSSFPTTGPTHFVLTAAGAIDLGGSGGATACVLTLFSGRAYCWGNNASANFGNGSRESSTEPVPAGGGLSFAALSVSYYKSCGIEKSSLALYCWGSHPPSGHDTYDFTPELAPLLVDGTHRFIAVSQGNGMGCALTIDKDTYCWEGGTGHSFSHW